MTSKSFMEYYNKKMIKRARSASLPAIIAKGTLLDSDRFTNSSASSSCDSNDSLNGKGKVSDNVKKKLKNMVGAIRRRSKSGGDISHFPGLQKNGQKRQFSLPYECILPVITANSYQHENIYRGLMHSLLHPLGVPETTIGLRPGDLLDYLREVFDVEREDHETFIREELSNPPKNLQVNVTLLEANGIRGSNFAEDASDSYCIVQVCNPAKGKHGNNGLTTPKHSPRPSPRQSPTGSPYISPMLHRKGAVDTLQAAVMIQRTSLIRSSSQPKWNEEFSLGASKVVWEWVKRDKQVVWTKISLDILSLSLAKKIRAKYCKTRQGSEVEDLLTDEINIYMFDQDFVNGDARDEKQNGIKSLLSRHKSSSLDQDVGCIGKVTVPIRNISAMGTDDWFDIVLPSPQKAKSKPIGKCHLQLVVSYKMGSEENEQYTTEEYYKAYKRFLSYTFTEGMRHSNDLYGQLSLRGHKILKMFAEAHGISKLSQAMVNVISLLDLHCETDGVEISEYQINMSLDDLRMTWATMQIGQKSILDRMPLTDTEVSSYRRVASKFIQMKCTQLDDLPKLFPPTLENLNAMEARLGITVQLLSLDLWEPKCDPQRYISQQVLERLEDDIASWIDEESKKIPDLTPDIKDKVIPEIQNLTDLINTVGSHCNILPVNKQFYTSLGINYYRVVCLAVEKKICSLTKTTIDKMDKYNRRYNNFQVNITVSSKLSLSLYFALWRLCSVIKDNVTRREMFRLSIFQYQDWFEESMINWLQTFRSECINRMEKALEIEKDVVVVTSLVKYSHSSVDVLSCFAQVIGEWKRIDFKDADCNLIGVTKITDIICDGARIYADKIHTILERNCYYDDNLNAEFDVNDRLCITINNIEHVRLYLGELPQLLSWEAMATSLSVTHDREDVGKHALDTLQRLIDVSNSEILTKSSLLLREIAEKIRVNMVKYMDIFTRKEPHKASSVDQFLGYISHNLQTFNEQLMPDIYPYMIEQLWVVVLQSLQQQMLVGQKVDYYEQMKQHLRALGFFFQRAGLEEAKRHSYLYDEVKEWLDLNSKKSEDLMLMYYKRLTTDLSTPPECYGHLAFKVAYVEETRGNMTIYVTVLRGTDLPGLDASGYSDPYVEVSLQPQAMFAWTRPQRTHIVKQTLNPVFNITLQFPNISKEYLQMQGACILLTVYDHDTIGWDDYAGEVIVHIPSLERISINNSMDKIPAIIMPLKRPQKPMSGPFTILSQRDWDRPSKTFVADRMRFIEHQPTRTDKEKSKEQGFFSFFSYVFN